MILRTHKKNTRGGFTLVEMIGVLAVIAVLAAMLIPKVFEAINSSKINNTTSSINTLKQAVADHYTKWGKFANSDGTTLDATGQANFDSAVLLAEGRIDKPFVTKIGDQTTSSQPTVLVSLTPTARGTPTATSINWDLDGNGTSEVDSTSANSIVYLIINDVSANDAIALSERLDGSDMSQTSLTAADLEGAIKYAAPASGITDIYVYIAHR